MLQITCLFKNYVLNMSFEDIWSSSTTVASSNSLLTLTMKSNLAMVALRPTTVENQDRGYASQLQYLADLRA